MANKLQEDLKLIVGVEGSKSGNVPAHTLKDKIKGKRGIVYFNADGTSSAATGNTPSTNEDGTKEEGTTQPDAGGADAGTSGGAYNGGNATADVGIDGPYPIDDATQENAGIFAVDAMTLGDIVKGVSGLKDCATDQPVDVRFDGQFTAPDGWDGPNSPPPVEGYSVGYYWRYWTGSSYLYGSSPGAVIAAYNAWAPAGFSLQAVATTEITVTVRVLRDGVLGWINTWIGRHACGSSSDDYCTVSPVASEWPAEKPTQLTYNSETGKYETHEMDGNVPEKFSQPVSSFRLCDENGDPVESFALGDGGQALYNETTGVATFMDASGKVTGYGDGASITNRQPR